MMFMWVKQCCVCGVVSSTHDKKAEQQNAVFLSTYAFLFPDAIVFLMTCNDECFKYLDECI